MNAFKDYLELTKPRLTLMALVTVAIAFYLAAGPGTPKSDLAWVLIGAALVGAGANTLNQWLEREIDKRMKRTAARPIPSGRITPQQALVYGLSLSVAGVTILAFKNNFLTAAMGLATLVSYVWIYTPLKQKNAFNTFVGAVPGALPVFMGWTAAEAPIDVKAWSVFAILFFWQLPHFFAIAWMYREDYQNAGFYMISRDDHDAKKTSGQVLIWSPVLFLSTFFPVFAGLSGSLYFSTAFISGIFFLALALFAGSHQMKQARAFMIASIVYLCALNAFLLFDKV